MQGKFADEAGDSFMVLGARDKWLTVTARYYTQPEGCENASLRGTPRICVYAVLNSHD